MQNKQLKILGLTGGIAAGKSVVSAYLKKLGGFVFDCDKIAHNVMLSGNKAYKEIRIAIPGDYIGHNNEINRKKLGEIVFNDTEKLKWLEGIVHKAVGSVIERKISTLSYHDNRFIVIDAPLLMQSDIREMCDKIWIVEASVDIRANRLMKRNNLNMDEALHRINIQAYKGTLNKDEFVIINNENGITELKLQIKKRLREFL